ncbi:MAG: M20/M25/M40 family metallo-hydrolase [Thermoleophilia bacterium]|nr:M20/M25/M40 family metallo-hydrolase [Thermoleophilia bacterium]MDH4347051.1 M20/M25/M40 family metallo-hydrolase [Thermoleophilia bacterium]MDH5333023.1 M20/M25/M40 family metallo-hydrolase [Thermoleophilia bacterium]
MTHPALDDAVLAEARRVHEAASHDLDVVLADLETWVNTDTPGGDISALDRFAAELGHLVEGHGLHPELVPAGERGLYLHASLEGAGTARVALLCHHDTVFPHGTAAARPFHRDAACCYGPGVADMKGGLAVAVHAARLLALGPRPFARLELVSVPDEESRPTAPETIDRLDGFDAVLCLECGRPDGEIVSARKGAMWFRVEAAGHPAHAGVEPDVGRNAIHALATEAIRLLGLHHARVGLTLQLTSITGGEGLNTVPSRASLTGDMRAIMAADLDWAIAEVAAFARHDGVELTVEDLGGPPAYERTPDVAALAEAAILIGGALGHVFGEALTGGVSDGSWTAAHGLPTLDGLGPVGGLDHGPNEYVETATIPTRCGVVAGLVAAVDAGLLRGAR